MKSMGVVKAFLTPEEVYAYKVLDYTEEVRKIRDGEEKLQAVNDGEAFLFPLLSDEYYLANEKLKKEYQEKYRGNALALANARFKLQMREIEKANILGASGIRVIQGVAKENEKKISEELQKKDDVEI